MPALLRSFNPASGEPLGAVPATEPAEVAGIVAGVAGVQPLWAAVPARERARLLRRVVHAMLDEVDALVELITAELGRPRTEALVMEVLPSLELVHRLADAGPDLLARQRLVAAGRVLRQRRGTLAHEPLGVVGVISSWSEPWSAPVARLAPALMAGNGAVLKPSSHAALTAERLVGVLVRAGLPEGLVRVVHGPGTGPALVDSAVGGILFTGSRATGLEVAQRCARGLKPCALALSGQGPAVVLGDAPLERAAAGTCWGAFANAGQAPAGVGCAIVAKPLAERFAAAVGARAARLRVGDPVLWGTEIGPLCREGAAERAWTLVEEALEAGATLLCGAPPRDRLLAPAVLAGVTPDMGIAREPCAAPVLAVIGAPGDTEAVELACARPPAAGASLWTRDRAQGERIARDLPAGTVWINDHGAAVTRARPGLGLPDCVRTRMRVWDPGRLRSPWWHPYDRTLATAARRAAVLLYGRESERPAALRAGALPLARLAARMTRPPRP